MMSYLFQSPVNYIFSILLLVLSIFTLFKTVRYWILAYRNTEEAKTALLIVRGLRNLVIALTSGAFAAGLYWSKEWLLIIGLVILGQEIYETGFLSMILKTGEDIHKN
jgi:hypothetical protein